MAYKNKAYHEKKFVEQILDVGIERVYETDEGNKTYYCFDLKNGTQRFWRDLSEENRIKLGIVKVGNYENSCNADS